MYEKPSSLWFSLVFICIILALAMVRECEAAAGPEAQYSHADSILARAVEESKICLEEVRVGQDYFGSQACTRARMELVRLTREIPGENLGEPQQIAFLLALSNLWEARAVSLGALSLHH